MKALGILAHPDDEIIFGWPVFQNRDIERHLLTISHNANTYGKRSMDALREVCLCENINLIEWPGIDNMFYRLPDRYARFCLIDAVKKIKNVFSKSLADVKPDFIFTHNPMGEYGHGDHKLLFELIASFAGTIRFTDICIKTNDHISYREIPKVFKRYFTNQCYVAQRDDIFYDRCQEIYKKYASWSWPLGRGGPQVGVWQIG